MTRRLFSIILLALIAAPAAALERADIDQVFGIMLGHSQLDSYPGMPVTKIAYVPPAKERGVLAEASPALAGEKEGSRVEVEARNLAKVLQTRAQAAFIIGHELAHLKHRDQDRFLWATADFSSAWFASEGRRLKALGVADDEINKAFGKAFDAATQRISAAEEDQADIEAQAWLAQALDPRTGRPFGAQAAVEALEAVKGWRDAQGLPDTARFYPSLASRIEAAKRRAALSRGPDLSGLASPVQDW